MKQFTELKNGDRFYYENDIPQVKFTAGKLEFNFYKDFIFKKMNNLNLPSREPFV